MEVPGLHPYIFLSNVHTRSAMGEDVWEMSWWHHVPGNHVVVTAAPAAVVAIASHHIPLGGWSLALCCFRRTGPGSSTEGKHNTPRSPHGSPCFLVVYESKCSLYLLRNVEQELCGALPAWQWRCVSRLGDRWQRPGAWGITYSHGGLFLSQPLSSDGNEVVAGQATQKGAWRKMSWAICTKIPSLNNFTVSQYPWGHLFIGCLISFAFFKSRSLKDTSLGFTCTCSGLSYSCNTGVLPLNS